MLYDLRMNATAPGMLAPLQRENLRAGCARKGIQYKHAGLGAKSHAAERLRSASG